MGKKKIYNDNNQTESVHLEESSPVPAVSIKDKKSKKVKDKIRKKKKNKKIQDSNIDQEKLLRENNHMDFDQSVKSSSQVDTKLKSKKIYFVNDEPQEVPENVKLDKVKTLPANAQKNVVNDDNESNVNDEDIAQFCDQLDEEENRQYENWVQLIEAKLNGHKGT